MNIAQYFFDAAQQQPTNVAFLEKGKTYHYAELAKLVQQVAAYLKQQGYQKGDNILVVIPPSVNLYVNLLAIFTIGARAVLVDNILPRKRVLYALEKAECKGVLATPILSALLFFFGKAIRKRLTRAGMLTRTYPNIATVKKEDTALITFTSGTTGKPKAANRTHNFLNTQLQTIIKKMDLKAGDVHLTSFPVVLLCNLAVGATSIIAPKRENKQAWQKIKEQYNVNVVSASPHYFNAFIINLKKKHLEKIVIGGASIYPHFVQALKDKPYANAIQFVYGSTEAEPIATLTLGKYLQYNQPKEKGICVGKNHPNILIKVVEIKEGKMIDLQESQIGEIIVAGPHVLKNYYKDPEAFAKNKIELKGQVWHRTGDAGYLKNDQLYFFGRMKHCWVQEEEYLSPLTLEKYASEKGFTGQATWLNVKGETLAFYAGGPNNFKKLLEGFPYAIDRVIQLKKLPTDKRHKSRVDYEGLVKKFG